MCVQEETGVLPSVHQATVPQMLPGANVVSLSGCALFLGIAMTCSLVASSSRVTFKVEDVFNSWREKAKTSLDLGVRDFASLGIRCIEREVCAPLCPSPRVMSGLGLGSGGK